MNTKPLAKKTQTGLSRFQDAVSDLFNRFFEDWDLMPSTEGRTWWPLLDVNERENEIIVKAELPGMKPEDFDLTVQGNVLTITGQKSESQEQKKENYHHLERRYGSFRRDVNLPTTVATDNIEAGYENGILTITLPKIKAATPRKVKVHVQEPVLSDSTSC